MRSATAELEPIHPIGYQPVPTSCALQVSIQNPEIVRFIDAEAQKLDVPFDIAAGLVLARGVRMIKQTREAMKGTCDE